MSETSNELMYRPELTPDKWQMIMSVAPAMHQARWFGVTNPEQAAAIMLKGYELGYGLSASFEFIQPVQGRPALSPRGMLALIHASPACKSLEIHEARDDAGVPQSCRVTMERINGFKYTCEFTMDDARRAGLVKHDSGWEKYPANMLKWRAVGFCADVVFPDLLGGMKRADEFGADIDLEGNVVNAEWTTVQAAPAPAPEPTPVTVAKAEPVAAPAPRISLTELADKYGPERIISVYGRIPGNDDELRVAAEMLSEVSHA